MTRRRFACRVEASVPVAPKRVSKAIDEGHEGMSKSGIRSATKKNWVSVYRVGARSAPLCAIESLSNVNRGLVDGEERERNRIARDLRQNCSLCPTSWADYEER